MINRCQRKAMSLFSLRGLAHDDDIQKFNKWNESRVSFLRRNVIPFVFIPSHFKCLPASLVEKNKKKKKIKIKKKNTNNFGSLGFPRED